MSALVSSSCVGWALSPAAHADPLCEYVSTSGTVIGTHSAGTCVPFNYGTLCDYETAGGYPQALVSTELCVPAPIVSSTSQSTSR